MSLVSLLKGKGPSGFGYGSTAEEVTEGLDLGGRTYLVTGSNSGLGRETVRVLLLRGARVLATGRSEDRVQRAFPDASECLVPMACELSEPSSVRACIEAVKKQGTLLDGLICNAGIMALPKLEVVHGFERQFFTNHIGHFILVRGLLDRLTETGRVVMLSSGAHAGAPRAGIEFDNLSGAKGYMAWKAYGQSKLANLLFAKELAKHLAGTGKTANAVHPGVIHTNLARNMGSFVDAALALAGPIALKNVAQGAATQVYVATHPGLEGVSGEYFADCNLATPTRAARDEALAARLWEESTRIVAGLDSN